MLQRLFSLLCPLAVPATLLAQQLPAVPVVPDRPAPTATLTLAEALEQSRRNSPVYRQTLNDLGQARWAVRNAYGNLLPSVDVGGSVGYTGSGQSSFGGSLFNQSSPSLTSGYGVNFSWQLSGQTLTAPGEQKAAKAAIEEDITNAGEQLRADVTTQYLSTLQAIAQTDVSRSQVIRNGEFLQLAQARFQVGQATLLDVRQAQVQKGQADVALLRAQQTENEAKLELFRRMGVSLPVTPEQLALPDSFPVADPGWNPRDLLTLAKEQNPQLRALRARERSAGWAVRSAKSRFLPSLSANAQFQGFTQEFTDEGILVGRAIQSAQGTANNCQFQNDIIRGLPAGQLPNQPNGGLIDDCNDFAGLDATGQALRPEQQSAILTRNDVFPFSFTGQPFRMSLSVSIPIFSNFSRTLGVAQAQAQRDDLQESVRARELLVETEVTARYLQVQTAIRAIQVQALNRDAAREQLRLAQDRYRLGSGSALELTDAQTSVQQAETDYVTSVYDYHRAVAALEFAVGRPLR